MIIENATNLGELPGRAPIVVAPLEAHAANGAPVRILALAHSFALLSLALIAGRL